MLKTITTAAIAALAFGYASTANAAAIMGSLSIGTAVTDAGSLDTASVFTVNGLVAGATGNFTPTVPSGIPGGTLVTFSSVNVASGTGVSFNVGSYGVFASNSVTDVITPTATNADYYVLGTFTPAGALSTFDAGAASVRLSFNRTGNAAAGFQTSLAVTLASPPASNPVTPPPTQVPEPASLALLGAGLIGLGAMRRQP